MSTATAPQPYPALYQPRKRPLLHPLSDGQLTAYRRDGFVIIPQVLDATTIGRLRQAADRMHSRADLRQAGGIRCDHGLHPNSKQPYLWKIDPIVDVSESFRDFSNDRRIRDRIASIYDGREGRLFKDKLIYKPPGAIGNMPHQDYSYWQGFPTSLLTVTLSLDAGTIENGCTELFPGHERGLLTPKGVFAHVPPADLDERRCTRLTMQPGDLAIFNAFVPHRSGINNSTSDRRQLFFTYNDSADGEHYAEHYEHYLAYVAERRGLKDIPHVP